MIYHETGIDGGANISAEGVPTLRIEEVPELAEVVVDQELGCPEVEPGVELVNDGLVTNDAEHSHQADH
jgi:hypothetical protein